MRSARVPGLALLQLVEDSLGLQDVGADLDQPAVVDAGQLLHGAIGGDLIDVQAPADHPLGALDQFAVLQGLAQVGGLAAGVLEFLERAITTDRAACTSCGFTGLTR